MQPKTIQMFVSYSHQDSLWVQEGQHGLIPWLAHVLRRDHVQIWHDHALKQMPGENYKKLIKSEIDRADFAILLISQDFVASDFIQEYELPWIRQRTEQDKLGLITILVGPVCDEDLDWLADRQMLPGKPMPLIEYTDNVAMWQRVRHEILTAVRSRLRAFREASGGTTTSSSRDEARTAETSDTPAAKSSPASRPAPAKPEPVQPSAAVSPANSSGTAAGASTVSRPPAATPPAAKVIVPKKGETVTPPSSPLEIIANSIGMPMALIPVGEFLMGSPDSDMSKSPDELPQHRVRITRPFYLGVYPVTQAEYERVMGVNPSHFKNAGPPAPVETVSWEDAQEFCRRLSELPAEQEAGHVYRLPTEAEWEYACRAGSKTKWSFGDSESSLGDYAWYENNSGKKTHPVGQKKPNAWGLYDMHGNVWEWCFDWYGNYVTTPVDDPTGTATGSFRVGHGGGWGDDAGSCRSAGRDRDTPGNRSGNLGFRLALSSVDQSEG